MGYLKNTGNVIISQTSTPTSAEIAAQFAPQVLREGWESISSSDSGRTDDGILRNQFVISNVRKVEITLKPCTADVISSIIPKVQGKEYYLTYFSAYNNSEFTFHAYTGNSSCDMYSGVVMNGLWQNVSFNAIGIGD